MTASNGWRIVMDQSDLNNLRDELHPFETDVRAAGQELFALAAARRPSLYRGFNGKLLARAMADDGLRTALFQFVDVLPQLTDSRQVAAHLRAYFAQASVPGLTGWLLRMASRPALACAVRRQSNQLAHHFLADQTEAGLAALIAVLAQVPALATVDTVGELVLTEAEADAYQARNLNLLRALPRCGQNPPHLSLKLTALTSRFDPLDAAGTRRRVFARLAPIVAAADKCGATLTVDMEHYELKPLILRLFLDMLDAWPGHWQAAIAVQAYLPETVHDVETLLTAAQRHGRKISVRLVKGAYWDQERAWAAQRNWPLPVFHNKAQTDALFECITQRLLENTDCLHPAIASHNLRSQAVALAWARRLELAPQRWEAQMIYGMAEPLRDAVSAAGVTMRVYVPVGDATVGIAYLIRRLLENTASNSILRRTYVDDDNFEALMTPPALDATSANVDVPTRMKIMDTHSAAQQGNPKDNDAGSFTNLPLIDFSRQDEQATFSASLIQLRTTLPRRHALARAAGHYSARNPADPNEVLGEIDLADAAHADNAVTSAAAAFPAWRDTSVAERVRLMRRVANLMEQERRSLTALIVLEASKSWREADGEMAEAVDFVRYYAAQMERIGGWHETVCFPGEDNRITYAPRGVAVVIAPWNFPLAILAGMTSAALVTGNCAVMKPALPGLLCAHAFLDILHRAGLPPDVCQLLPGDAEVGAQLVADPRIHIVAFTGSRAVGLKILQAANTPASGQRHIKQVVCELGGKNAIVVDTDADLDEAVTGILASAFGYSGQKCSACSRIIAVGNVQARLLPRLADAAAALVWGPPEDPSCEHGPLITEAAQRKAADYIEIGKTEGRVLWQGKAPTPDRSSGCSTGWYVAPTIFVGIKTHHRLAQEEVFGPVLVVLHAPDFDTALDMALDSDYGLTGGVYSRLPSHLVQARERYRIGNLYLNRKITGARVGIQPFGGIALSGTGVQVGGPDYIKQFMWSRCVAVNTMRHGFIPNE
jgi:RHH-type proline utilization regulon transcriptional repressor/proline dehydrogenase/delta 1-pyrroline-5-carboxylate dehydrogenase